MLGAGIYCYAISPGDDRGHWENQHILACVHVAHAKVIATRTQDVFALTDDFRGVSAKRAAAWKQKVHCSYMSIRLYYALLWYVLFIEFPAFLHLEKNNPLGISDEVGMKWLTEKMNAFAADDLPFSGQTEIFARWSANFELDDGI